MTPQLQHPDIPGSSDTATDQPQPNGHSSPYATREVVAARRPGGFSENDRPAPDRPNPARDATMPRRDSAGPQDRET